MTTIPSRLPFLEPVIRNICNEQTVRPHKLYLFLPVFSTKEQCYYPTAMPFDVKPFSQLRVQTVRQDWGPITKLYPVLETIPVNEHVDRSTVVITIDDDTIYDTRTIEYLVQGWILQNRKSDTVICLSGFLVGTWRNPWIHLDGDDMVTEPTAVDWPVGVRGVLYPMSLLRRTGTDLIDWDKYDGTSADNDGDGSSSNVIPPEAKYTDDIWIGGTLCKSGAQVIKIPYPHEFWDTKSNGETNRILPLMRGIFTNVDAGSQNMDMGANAKKNQYGQDGQRQLSFIEDATGSVRFYLTNRNVALSIRKRFPGVFRTPPPKGLRFWARRIRSVIFQPLTLILLTILIIMQLLNHFFFERHWLVVCFVFVCILLIVAVLLYKSL